MQLQHGSFGSGRSSLPSGERHLDLYSGEEKVVLIADSDFRVKDEAGTVVVDCGGRRNKEVQLLQRIR